MFENTKIEGSQEVWANIGVRYVHVHTDVRDRGIRYHTMLVRKYLSHDKQPKIILTSLSNKKYYLFPNLDHLILINRWNRKKNSLPRNRKKFDKREKKRRFGFKIQVLDSRVENPKLFKLRIKIPLFLN